MVTITTQRASLPTLWIDTGIVLNLATRDKDPRCSQLQQVVRSLVRGRKILCPNADQHEEFEGRKLDDGAFGVLEDLSLGIHFRHRKGIMDNLVAAAMRAFVEKGEAIETTLRCYFHSDPVEQLMSVSRERFFISMGLSRNPEVLTRRESAKHAGRAELEDLRKALVAKRQQYGQQLLIELEGDAVGLIDSLQSFEKKSADGTATSWDFMDVLNPRLYLKMWNDFGGQPSGWNGMIRFFKSDYCAALPTSRISSQLWADLLTDPQRPIKPSDSMDVNLLSVAMPICHFVVTDKDMENRLKRRQIDREWKTEVFSLSTIDVLLDRLEEIEKFPK